MNILTREGIPVLRDGLMNVLGQFHPDPQNMLVLASPLQEQRKGLTILPIMGISFGRFMTAFLDKPTIILVQGGSRKRRSGRIRRLTIISHCRVASCLK
jgi:hypothetical protein